jgi:propionyl-CoA carboxylase alpha chain
VFGDQAGNVVHLFERDCSVQRRYQKVIEESPSPAVDDALRKTLGAAAVTAASTLGYVGAGTVEFVVDPDGAFFFLEVNTRLQVEHPVTEAVTGLDLVELQLRVARGEPLPAEVADAGVHGHAVEARLYAEDVPAGFVPAAGRLDRFDVPAGPGIRVDAGYRSGSSVGTDYDAMLAKVIAWGPTRAEAVVRLADALDRARIHGVATNRDLLVRVLRDPAFVAGQVDTGFLSRPGLTETGTGPTETDRVAVALAAALAERARRLADRSVHRSIPAGWRNVPTALQRVRYVDRHGDASGGVAGRHGDARGEAEIEVGYDVRAGGFDSVIEIDGGGGLCGPVPGVRVRSADPHHVDIEIDGIRRHFDVEIEGDRIDVDGPGVHAELRRVPRFPLPGRDLAPGSLLAPLPGTVARVLVGPGDHAHTGDPLVVLEAMKMEHPVRAPWPGTVTEVDVEVGAQVDAGVVLVVMSPDAPTDDDRQADTG